jgi:hypothetical protein
VEARQQWVESAQKASEAKAQTSIEKKNPRAESDEKEVDHSLPVQPTDATRAILSASASSTGTRARKKHKISHVRWQQAPPDTLTSALAVAITQQTGASVPSTDPQEGANPEGRAEAGSGGPSRGVHKRSRANSGKPSPTKKARKNLLRQFNPCNEEKNDQQHSSPEPRGSAFIADSPFPKNTKLPGSAKIADIPLWGYPCGNNAAKDNAQPLILPIVRKLLRPP